MSLIAYIGKPGSFSHAAARKQYGIDHTYIGCISFSEICKLVNEAGAEIGVIPLENSLAGSIYENYDLFNQYPLQIVAEQYLKVEHFLLAKNSGKGGDERLKEIKIVYSHPKALEQCKDFFITHPWMKPTIANDTATAAAQVAESADISFAAIGSEDSSHLYRLKIFAKNIEDDGQNYTRFVYVAKVKQVVKTANKCSLQLEIRHQPGSLVKALETLSAHQINLTKIESRPIHGKPFEYQFYIDFEYGSGDANKLLTILDALTASADRLKVLGTYIGGKLNM